MPTFTDVLIDQYQTARDLLILLNYAIDNDRFDVFHRAYTSIDGVYVMPMRIKDEVKTYYESIKRDLELSQIALVTLNYDIGRLLTTEWLAELDTKVASLTE